MKFLLMIHGDETGWDALPPASSRRARAVRRRRPAQRGAARGRARPDVERDHGPRPGRQHARDRRPVRRDPRGARRHLPRRGGVDRRRVELAGAAGPAGPGRHRGAPRLRRTSHEVLAPHLQRPVRRRGDDARGDRAGPRGGHAAVDRALRLPRLARRVGRGLRARRAGDGEDAPLRGRPPGGHRRSVCRDEGADRRPLPDRVQRPRRGDRHGGARAGRRAARSRSGRWSRGGPADRRGRARVPRGVGPLARLPGAHARRSRPRRGRRPGRVHGRARALAARRRAGQPGRVDRHHGAEPRDRPHPPRAEPRAQDGAARAARGGGGDGRPRREHDPRRAAGAALHLLPPGARPGRAGRAHAAAGRRAADAGDRPRVPAPRADARAAARPREAEDPAGRDPVPRAARPPAARAARRRARRRLPDLQRGVRGDRRRTARPRGAVRRGDPARAAARGADARRAGGARPARAAAVPRLAAGRPHRRRRRARAARRPGPHHLERRRDRRGDARARPRAAAPAARAVPAAGRHRRAARRGADGGRDRLAADRRALRRARARPALAGRRAQPGGRGRDGRRARGRAGAPRRARRARALPPAARDACRPPAPARACARKQRTPTGGRSSSRRTRSSAPSSSGGYTRSRRASSTASAGEPTRSTPRSSQPGSTTTTRRPSRIANPISASVPHEPPTAITASPERRRRGSARGRSRWPRHGRSTRSLRAALAWDDRDRRPAGGLGAARRRGHDLAAPARHNGAPRSASSRPTSSARPTCSAPLPITDTWITRRW